MRRSELEHVPRAASHAVGLRDFVVIGSASILATYPESALPDAATRSDEADLAVFEDPIGEVAMRIDGAIGELSPFHATHGYYGQGVEVTTARLAEGWEQRLVRYRNRNTGRGMGWCLDRHDCVASKLIAFRDKDREFAAALFTAGLVDPTINARARPRDAWCRTPNEDARPGVDRDLPCWSPLTGGEGSVWRRAWPVQWVRIAQTCTAGPSGATCSHTPATAALDGALVPDVFPSSVRA